MQDLPETGFDDISVSHDAPVRASALCKPILNYGLTFPKFGVAGTATNDVFGIGPQTATSQGTLLPPLDTDYSDTLLGNVLANGDVNTAPIISATVFL